MANLFSATEAPTKEPIEFIAGDYVQWKREDLVNDYPTDSYTLTYVLRKSGGAVQEINITATGESNYYIVTLSSTVTATYEPGRYYYQMEISRDSDSARIALERGQIEILPDLDNTQADPRTHAEIMVDKIESVLNGKADQDVSSYSVAGRSLTRMSFSELTDARDYYRGEVLKQKAKLDAKRGVTAQHTVKVRF